MGGHVIITIKNMIVGLIILCASTSLVSGSLFVKYETQLGSPISIPIETSPPAKLINAPKWLTISDHDDKETGTSDPSPPMVLLLQGVAEQTGIWTFSVADQVGIVSIQIQVVDATTTTTPTQDGQGMGLDKAVEVATNDIDGAIRGPAPYEILEPSLDQVTSKRKRRRRTIVEGSGQGSSIGVGSDDEDYTDEDEEDEDYDDDDDPVDDILEEKKVPIEPTPTLLHAPEPTTSTTEEPASTPAVVEITPTLVTQTQQPQTSPVLMKPDFVEYGSGFEPNTRIIEQQPTFQKTHRNLEKFAISSGKLFRYKIPDDIFTPVDTKVRYTIEPASSNQHDSWIWIHGEDWIHALPRDKDISDYNLTLVAERIDSGEKANAQLIVSVRQPKRWRMYNHEIEVEWGKGDILEQAATSTRAVEEGVKLVRDVLGGSWDDDDIIVRKVETDGITFKLFYTNETLFVGHSQNMCPVPELNEIARKLKRRLDNVSIHLTGSLCEGFKQTNQQQPIPPTTNFPPDIKNEIDLIQGTQGEFMVYQVASGFCYDPEDGDTRQLKLSLLSENMEVLDDKNWLQFDEKNQEFYGLPGTSGHYTLVCTDSGGKSANDALLAQIEPQPIKPQSNYLTFNLHFQSADFKPPTIRKFIMKLAQAFNDSDVSNIIVKNYQESPSGNQTSVHFTWINRTNPAEEYEISELRKIMLSNEGPPKREFVEFFRPEFHISVCELLPSRIMIGGGTINEDVKISNTDSGDDEVTKIADYIDSSQYLITYVIPGILIFIMILLAVLIACLLSRQTNKSLANPKSTRFVATNNAILKKGVPVIFQDEYFDETEHQALNESSSRSPAILRDEHPPLPPEYRRHHVPSGRSNMNIQNYQPPPGFARGNPGPRPQQQQGFGGRGRNPPPYVPP